jgi:cell division protein ZapA (FtsZ GTPase activity inhibitor)
MNAIEISIGGQKYLLSGTEDELHLKDVADLVKRRVDSIRKERPSLSLQKAAILAAFDFASESIKGRKKGLDYRSLILSKARDLVAKLETDLANNRSPA